MAKLIYSAIASADGYVEGVLQRCSGGLFNASVINVL
jgi:hypothetical protein